jgi:peptidoglycan/xylan/chitin deacetylase (PgdA/CDA1 family)
MKICLLFHCLCESYEDIPAYGQDLFVSLPDLRSMIEELTDRGYRFASLEDPGRDTVSITFDDGYYNNLLFEDIAQAYSIPYLVLLTSYYIQTGDPFPWLSANGQSYEDYRIFDYYERYQELRGNHDGEIPSDMVRPMTFAELGTMSESDLVEIGCHGYYHQPLSRAFERYVKQERDLGMRCLEENLGITPRYYSLSNGMYTKGVMRELLQSFERVLTIEGRPSRPSDRIIHRITLSNPNITSPLVQQIDRQLTPLRRLRRAVRTFNRMHW